MIVTTAHPEACLYNSIHLLVLITPDLYVTQIIGTCFSVGVRGIFFTAAHNYPFFQDERYRDRHFDIFRYRPPSSVNHEETFTGVYRCLMDGTAALYGVERVQMSINHDFAVLFCSADKGPTNNQCPPALILADSLHEGRKVKVVGYTDNAMTLGRTAEGLQRVEVTGGLTVHEGHITHIYPEKKNDSANWYPCFDSTATMTGGQSGGPTLDAETGYVLGINSYSGDEGSVSSSVPPLLDIAMITEDLSLTGPSGEAIPLYGKTWRDLARINAIKIGTVAG